MKINQTNLNKVDLTASGLSPDQIIDEVQSTGNVILDAGNVFIHFVWAIVKAIIDRHGKLANRVDELEKAVELLQNGAGVKTEVAASTGTDEKKSAGSSDSADSVTASVASDAVLSAVADSHNALSEKLDGIHEVVSGIAGLIAAAKDASTAASVADTAVKADDASSTPAEDAPAENK
jgi:hypothetical protein